MVAIVWIFIQRIDVYREERIQEYMDSHELSDGIGFEQDRDGIRTISTENIKKTPSELTEDHDDVITPLLN